MSFKRARIFICSPWTQDNPLHISLFPPYEHATIDFSFLLNSCLDIFDIRRKQTSVDQDLGLLQAIDETLAAYGWLTTTGVKLLIIVDFPGSAEFRTTKQASPTVSGVRDSDLKPVCQEETPPESLLLIITPRHFGRCITRTFSSYRTPSIHQTTMLSRRQWRHARWLLANRYPTQNSLQMSGASGNHGLLGFPSR